MDTAADHALPGDAFPNDALPGDGFPNDALAEYAFSDYALLDVGDERRLERFGAIVVDRPAPGAIGRPADPTAWTRADARFDRSTEGRIVHAAWTTVDGVPIEPWRTTEADLLFELRLAPSGQVGLFPEQAANRRWIAGRVLDLIAGRGADEPAPVVLDLFAYTGGGTLAAVSAGAQATHVDASRPAVAWARRNAELNGLAERPVRWIADDAAAFVRREVRRGRRYDGIVLDPPTYGHGPGGADWRLERDLGPLLDGCAALLSDRPGAFIVLSAHTPGTDGPILGEWLRPALPAAVMTRGRLDVEDAVLVAESGTRLALGSSVRFARGRR
jgi:23S rRNA (cytosine1962-C5)-methyltransferase